MTSNQTMEVSARVHGFDLSRILALAGSGKAPEVVVIGVEAGKKMAFSSGATSEMTGGWFPARGAAEAWALAMTTS